MKTYKKWATAGVSLSIVGILAGCGTAGNGSAPTANTTNTASENKAVTNNVTPVANNTVSNQTTQNTTNTTGIAPANNSSIATVNSTTTNTQTMKLLSVYNVETNGTTYQIHPGQVNYDPAARMIHVVMTNKGVVWNPIPQMKLAISNQTLLRNYPLQPFSIYLNAQNDSTLSVSNSANVFTLPLQEKTSRSGTVYPFLDDLFGAGDFVIYSVDLRFVGGNQPISSELYTLDLNNNNSSKVTSYTGVSGNQFSIAISGSNVYYKQMLVNGPESIHEYSLTTGVSKQVTWAPAGLKWIAL